MTITIIALVTSVIAVAFNTWYYVTDRRMRKRIEQILNAENESDNRNDESEETND